MTGLEFVDTNIFVYAHDINSGLKRDRCRALITALWARGQGAVSTQVLSEFYSISLKKFKMPAADAEQTLAELGEWIMHRPKFEDLIEASGWHRRHGVPWWDALILQSALALGCTTLWTEDFTHGQRFGSLTIRNPFGEDQ